ncbi:histidine kinase [Chitinophaga caeni]|uniref:Histidine kinase n=1 Tax=Chitinophaga caeni TaxID=2029983 RepID=A0A291R0C9_9BACT|nr:histidine kinase [Chitinophaga caeni]ATL49657.1 histidine kinase [Chitinophaga caeni]
MSREAHNKLIKFYLYTGLGFILLYSFGEFFEYRETIVRRVINSIFLVSYLTALHYMLFEQILPLFRWPCKNNQRPFFFLFVIILFYTFGLYGWRQLWIQLGVYIDYTPNLSFLKGVVIHAQFSIATIIFFAIVRNVYNNIQLREKYHKLRIEKKEAELNYLKSQTNPHFLFNTLNNIYSLARDKSELAPESILRLSKILRFMLYEAGGVSIAIGDELKIITDYIALEKLRYDDSLLVTLNTDIENSKQPLPPLLLIPLVENAFKHGASETRNDPFVDINLNVKQMQLLFTVKNSVEDTTPVQELKENIGLSNLRKQLALLYNDYDLSVGQDKSVFASTLRINLASNV